MNDTINTEVEKDLEIDAEDVSEDLDTDTDAAEDSELDFEYDENGDIVFCGRRDSLIKHSGYRIELSEIEHVITNTLKLVPNGCVVYNHGKHEIVLFYENDRELSAAEFRTAIGDWLPAYMVPTDFRRVAALPRGGTGKIDRGALTREVNS